MKLKSIILASCISLMLPLGAIAETADIYDFYSSSKNGKVIDFVGDSTSEVAPALYNQLSSNGSLNEATINNRGSNGNTLHNFINNIATNDNTIDKALNDKADLYVLSYGINDIREGKSSPEQIKEDLKTTIDRLLKETNGYILLRIPNTFLSADPTNSNFLTPLENAQLYSDQLWDIYESFKGYSSRVDIIDVPSLVFGRKSFPEHRLMHDVLHPNDDGYRAIADVIADRITGKTKDTNYSFSEAIVLINMCKENYMSETTDGGRNKWHQMANEIRRLSGQPVE